MAITAVAELVKAMPGATSIIQVSLALRSSSAFSRALVGSCIESKAAGTQTGAQVGLCQMAALDGASWRPTITSVLLSPRQLGDSLKTDGALPENK